jgi:prephenate dehydratase
LRVAYLGPAGTFTEEALHQSAPDGVDEVPYASVYEAVMAVQDGEVERAVVPIENSIEGSVNATLDALAGDASDVRIAGELVLTIEHCLVARDSLELDEITRVVSHPQATAQCAGFLRDRLPRAERITVASTAEAVRTVAEADEPWAALGSRLAATLYGCRVLAEGVEDHPHNQTRFVWLAHESALPPLLGGQPLKTSIAFSGFNDDSPGALVSILSELSDRGINLSKIESRPRRVQLGHYIIFADLDGGLGDPAVADGLDAVSGKVRELRVLGSYPAAKGSG